MSNVINIREALLTPDKVLNKAVGKYQDVLLIGWNVDGPLDWRTSKDFNVADLNFCLDRLKAKLLDGDYSE